MLTARVSLRSVVTLLLSLGCLTLAVIWPSWLTAFRAEGAYGPTETSVAGSVAVSAAGVQSANISLRLGALRGDATRPGSRAASADPSQPLGVDFFLNGLGSVGDQSATSREPAFDFRTAGLTLGGDYKVTDSLILGAAFGYLNTRTEIAASAGDIVTNGYSLSGFGNYYIGDLYVDGIFTAGWNTYDIERNIPGLNETAHASPDGHQFALSVGSGYSLSRGALSGGPFAKVNYLRVHIDAYRERGTTASDLQVDRQTIESLTTDLGAQMSYAIGTPWAVLSPMAQFAWEHEFKNDRRTITGFVTSNPATALSITTNKPDRDYFNLGTGVTSTFKHGITAFFYYEAVVGRDDFTKHSFTGGVRFPLD